MRRLDEQYTRTPYYGVRRMTAWLRREGWGVNPKRVRRLLRRMGLEAIYPKPRLSAGGFMMRTDPHRKRWVPGSCGKISLKVLSGHGFNRAENNRKMIPSLLP